MIEAGQRAAALPRAAPRPAGSPPGRCGTAAPRRRPVVLGSRNASTIASVDGDQRAAALVRKGLGAVAADRLERAARQRRHRSDAVALERRPDGPVTNRDRRPPFATSDLRSVASSSRISRSGTACRCRGKSSTMTPSRMRAATSSAAASAAPLDTPTSSPSSDASRRVQRVGALGRDPQILVGQRADRRSPARSPSPCASALRSPCSGESGCTEISGCHGVNSRSRRPTPMNVPLVPRPATKWVIRPSVCSRISTAVVS